MNRKGLNKNYSKRHENEKLSMHDRCRVYHPAQDSGMSTGIDFKAYQVESKADNCYRGFAYDSTRRAHVD
jgi:hypothetical protein